MGEIYQIRNVLNDKIYIGSSKNLKKRWTRHRSDLKMNCHHSDYLQRSWNKYGKDFFVLEVIEETDDLFRRELFWIETLCPEYNVGGVGGGDNLTNNPNRDKIIEQMKATLNKTIGALSEEERSKKWGKSGENNPNWKNGISSQKVFCQTCKKEISKGHKSCVTCSKVGDSNPFFGKKHSEEFKNKRSEEMKGVYRGNQNKKIKINGIVYDSLAKAAKALGISNGLMTYRLKKNYLGYELID